MKPSETGGYRDYRIGLELRSPLGSPLQSDTLFGHLAWIVRESDGDEGVARFLEPFLAGRPPFVFSDAFPADLLPRPLFPVSDLARGPESPREYAARKRRLKAPWVTAADFGRLLRGEPAADPPVEDPWEEVESPHAAIDRRTWTTGGAGALYFTGARVLPDGPDGPPRLDLYARCQPAAEGRLRTLLERLAAVGFGRDRSVGAGEIALSAFEPTARLEGPDGADGFVSLSTFMPAASDPTDGCWRVRVKHGRLGPLAAAGEGGNPFKRPLVQIEPGAVFRAPGRPRPFYGRMVRDVAPGFPAAVQCGLCLAAGCVWPKGG